MNAQGSSEDQHGNLRDARVRRLITDFDLNYPPPAEDRVPTGPSEVQTQESGHYQGQAINAYEFVDDDDVVIISPQKFAEARNNFLRSRGGRDRPAEVGAIHPSLTELTNWFISNPTRQDQPDWMWEICYLGLFNTIPDTAPNFPTRPELTQSNAPPDAPAFTCTVCMDQLVDETSTKCGHIFCKKCINKVIDTQHKCPTCRRKLTKRDTIRIYLQHLLNN